MVRRSWTKTRGGNQKPKKNFLNAFISEERSRGTIQ
jgi:hypothetical protein